MVGQPSSGGVGGLLWKGKWITTKLEVKRCCHRSGGEWKPLKKECRSTEVECWEMKKGDGKSSGLEERETARPVEEGGELDIKGAGKAFRKWEKTGDERKRERCLVAFKES